MSEPGPPRVVFDCNVYFQALVRGTGPASACLHLAEVHEIQLVVSTTALEELRGVLLRLRTRRKFPVITEAVLQRFLTKIGSLSLLIEEVPEAIVLTRDPDDAHYLNLAVASGASFLVSRDQDLLHLTTSNSSEALALRQLAPALAILDPVTFLERLRSPKDAIPSQEIE